MPQVDAQPQRRMLILDFDGVIVETERVHFDSWNAAFQELFGVAMAGEHGQIVGLSLDQLYAMWQEQGLLPASALTDDLKRELLARKTAHFYAIGAERLEPMAGIEALVGAARGRGWYVAVASRSRRLRLLRTLELVGLTTPFDLILGTEDCVDAAADRKEHVRAARIFGIDPRVCVVVEDSASGVAEACASGIGHVIGLTTSLDRGLLLNAGAHKVVDSLDEVILP